MLAYVVWAGNNSHKRKFGLCLYEMYFPKFDENLSNFIAEGV